MTSRAVVFEDEPLIREFIAELLRVTGYEVFAFEEPGLCPLKGENGCRLPADASRPDVIVSDIHMPGTNGLDYIEKLRHLNCKQPRVAIVSGSWTDAERQRAARLGCASFEKPVRGPELIEWLHARWSPAQGGCLSNLDKRYARQCRLPSPRFRKLQ